MSKPNALVDGVDSLAREDLSAAGSGKPASDFVTVQFHGGQSGLLDLKSSRAAVWADVLESIRRAGESVYVEIDPVSRVITELLQPLRVQVGVLTPGGDRGDVEVELIISHARHHLRRSHPRFQALMGVLESARDGRAEVLVTETPDGREILDVRPAPPRERAAVPEPPTTALDVTMAPETETRARDLFNLVNARLCCPASGAPPCIPFLYPDDGCWGRAHEMCRLMIGAAAQPNKVWIYGNLRVATTNNPRCEVRWGWHVAPTLTVRVGAGTQVQVIDPSLFPGPVPQTVWAGAQGDPRAAVESSPAAAFYRTLGGRRVDYDDAAYTETQRVLATYRNQLRLRSVGSDGPPPYLQCAPKPAGVQWQASIGPGAVGRWFSWGWPASWHIVWTVMPLTPCPRGRQLSWKVQAERANASQCTYWITVTNLTPDPVKFEGRYDVLSR